MAWLRLALAWGAFVFIPFNLFAGTLIGREFAASEAILGLITGSTVLAFLTVPAVVYSSRMGRSYAQAVEWEVHSAVIRLMLVTLVPMVNIGWFTIQSIAATQLVMPADRSSVFMFVAYTASALVFVAGPVLWGFRWLYWFGAVAVIAMVVAVTWIVSVGQLQHVAWTRPDPTAVAKASLLVLGTWVFSSTTIVMDIACELPHPLRATSAVLCGTLLADTSLIVVGFLYPEVVLRLMQSGGQSSAFATCLMLIALWSTNDSNFYSTEKALAKLGIPRGIAITVVALITGIVGTLVGAHLFDAIGGWLQLMGWIGIPIGLFWLSRLGRQE